MAGIKRKVPSGTKRKAQQYKSVGEQFSDQYGGFGKKKKKKTKTPHGKRAPKSR